MASKVEQAKSDPWLQEANVKVCNHKKEVSCPTCGFHYCCWHESNEAKRCEEKHCPRYSQGEWIPITIHMDNCKLAIEEGFTNFLKRKPMLMKCWKYCQKNGGTELNFWCGCVINWLHTAEGRDGIHLDNRTKVLDKKDYEQIKAWMTEKGTEEESAC